MASLPCPGDYLWVDFADRIRSVREAIDATQEDVARAGDIPTRTYQRWEAGGAPNWRQLARVCVALRVTPDYLIGLVDDPTGRWAPASGVADATPGAYAVDLREAILLRGAGAIAQAKAPKGQRKGRGTGDGPG